MEYVNLVCSNSDKWEVHVKMVMNHQVPQNAGNFRPICRTVSFSRRTLLHGVGFFISYSVSQTGSNGRTILNGQKTEGTKQHTTVGTNGTHSTHTGVTTLKSIGRANWRWLRRVHLRVTPTSTSRCQRLLSRR